MPANIGWPYLVLNLFLKIILFPFQLYYFKSERRIHMSIYFPPTSALSLYFPPIRSILCLHPNKIRNFPDFVCLLTNAFSTFPISCFLSTILVQLLTFILENWSKSTSNRTLVSKPTVTLSVLIGVSFPGVWAFWSPCLCFLVTFYILVHSTRCISHCNFISQWKSPVGWLKNSVKMFITSRT